MRYGFVGLGNLGARLALNLLRGGFAVKVCDLDPANANDLIEVGAEWAPTAAAAADGVDGLITCLPSPSASSAALLGAHGALPMMSRGSTWIEMSTTDIKSLKPLNEKAAKGGVSVLEYPVTGGVHRAARGEMTVFVGGDKAVFETHLPALQAMCGPIFHMGDIGAASLIKVITNMLCLIDLIAAGEALMLAERGGLDLGQCYEAIKASSGNSREFEDWAPVILNGSLNTGFTLGLALKDLGFAMGLGRDLGVPLELTGLVERLFIEAREKYGAQAWTPHVIKVMEENTGVRLRADGFPEVIQ